MLEKTIKLPRIFIIKGKHLRKSISVLVAFSKQTWRSILVDFSNVGEIRKGDFMVLIAQLEKVFVINKKRIYRRGNIPLAIRKVLAKNILHFSKDLRDTLPENIDADKLRSINPVIISNLVKDLKKVGIDKKNDSGAAFYERIEALITEMVGNAIEHGIKKKLINCWLTSEVNYKTKEIIFTFVDVGLGIAKSHKDSGVALKYRIFGDTKIILDSLYGKLPSSTGRENRGKGLPEIRNMVEMGLISEFIMISNRTSLQYLDNRFISAKVPNFIGTYYSWTICKNDFEKWKNIK